MSDITAFPPVRLFLQLLGDTPVEMLINGALMGIILYLAWRWALEPVLITVRGMLNFWKMRKDRGAFLEIIPPAHSEKSPLATQQLFSILQTFSNNRSALSLEIISSREDGIRYAIKAHPDDLALIQQHLAAYLPEAKFRIIEQRDQTPNSLVQKVYEIKQSRHYAYPLQAHEELDKSDPISYITGSMTKLDNGEEMILQMTLAPHRSRWTDKLHGKIMSKGYAVIDRKLLNFVKSRPIWVWLIAALYGTFTQNLEGTLALLGVLLFVSAFIPQEEPELTATEQSFYENILRKLEQPLFRADIRLQISAKSNARLHDLTKGFAGSLAPLNSPGYQQLWLPRSNNSKLGQQINTFKAKYHLPSFLIFNANILSASELASIYHFPYGDIKTEGMARSHSRTLPAPLEVKKGKFDVVLGQNHHHGTFTPIGLTEKERERHIYIIGGTGNGKTTMLEYAMIQDIKNGKGLAFVDPHGDAAEFLLRHIPEDRINDVVYFNPDDLAHPIGLNLLELTPGLEGDELLREKDMVTEAAISVFRKIFSDEDNGGHRIEYVLRNSIQTALTIEGATIFTIFKLLNDPKFRKNAVAKLEDEDLKNFWKNELGKAGEFQRVKMSAGITAKIGRFLFSASAKRILEQSKSTINFDDVLDGKILICNFSKGLIGEDTSELFGITVLAKLQLAALRRARIPQAKRRPFYLYVDEFQNFATTSFVQLLSEARKYKLFLTMAEQSTSQQEEQQMVNIILANVGTVICFRSGNPADERMTLPLFRPYVEEGEIANLASFNFYIRISAVHSQEPFSGETIVPEDIEDNPKLRRIIQTSQENYTARPPTPSEELKPQKEKSLAIKRTGARRALPDDILE